MPYVLAIDAGTTSCRTLLFDEKLQVAGLAQEEFRQYFPQPGWVEHDAEEIFETQYRTLLKVLDKTSVPLEEIVAAGITNQRETVV
ncbi:MAG: glycerol kinase, partial [Chitinophagales bacterium]|nr:glycerol kinase [Chitinophagales bacterium]